MAVSFQTHLHSQQCNFNTVPASPSKNPISFPYLRSVCSNPVFFFIKIQPQHSLNLFPSGFCLLLSWILCVHSCIPSHLAPPFHIFVSFRPCSPVCCSLRYSLCSGGGVSAATSIYGCASYNSSGKDGGAAFPNAIYRDYIVDVTMYRNGWILVEPRVIAECVLGKAVNREFWGEVIVTRNGSATSKLLILFKSLQCRHYNTS